MEKPHPTLPCGFGNYQSSIQAVLARLPSRNSRGPHNVGKGGMGYLRFVFIGCRTSARAREEAIEDKSTTAIISEEMAVNVPLGRSRFTRRNRITYQGSGIIG